MNNGARHRHCRGFDFDKNSTISHNDKDIYILILYAISPDNILIFCEFRWEYASNFFDYIRPRVVSW